VSVRKKARLGPTVFRLWRKKQRREVPLYFISSGCLGQASAQQGLGAPALGKERGEIGQSVVALLVSYPPLGRAHALRFAAVSLLSIR